MTGIGFIKVVLGVSGYASNIFTMIVPEQKFVEYEAHTPPQLEQIQIQCSLDVQKEIAVEEQWLLFHTSTILSYVTNYVDVILNIKNEEQGSRAIDIRKLVIMNGLTAFYMKAMSMRANERKDPNLKFCNAFTAAISLQAQFEKELEMKLGKNVKMQAEIHRRCEGIFNYMNSVLVGNKVPILPAIKIMDYNKTNVNAALSQFVYVSNHVQPAKDAQFRNNIPAHEQKQEELIADFKNGQGKKRIARPVIVNEITFDLHAETMPMVTAEEQNERSNQNYNTRAGNMVLHEVNYNTFII